MKKVSDIGHPYLLHFLSLSIFYSSGTVFVVKKADKTTLKNITNDFNIKVNKIQAKKEWLNRHSFTVYISILGHTSFLVTLVLS